MLIEIGISQHMCYIIRMSEDFVLLVGLEIKCSQEAWHKGSCPVFFTEANCQHVALLTQRSLFPLIQTFE